ncbi:YggS family pyridoxal phosphate-dependent enzyme [Alicyclobacillus cycloheptanicus]|nr:YggS family pyridoxal phosphate-dependent enzyme [Alicyclobacillus cycloheptanicus]
MTEQVRQVRAAVDDACRRSGRSVSDVRIIAVTKSADESVLAPLADNGITDFAENRWPDARAKLEYTSQAFAAPPTWHFIGRLQLNKVKYVVPRFDWIHSIDSLELARAVSKRAVDLGRTLHCLIQVNVSGESTKAGVAPHALQSVLKDVAVLPGMVVSGLMTMAPQVDDPEQTRPVFRALRTLLVEARNTLSLASLRELSMGMSNDFPVAVEEGATMIRVGRRLVNIPRSEDAE